jgi:hypothetical protein
MPQTRFCTKNYQKNEVLEEIKRILLMPDLYNETEKYIKSSDQKKETYLNRLKHKAYKQWHSDVRTSQEPKAEFYAKCISEAIETFKLICENPDYFIDPISRTINIPDEEPEADVVISEMQEKLRNAIDEIFKKCRQTTEATEINKGSLYSDIIDEEQKLRMWEPAIFALIFYAIASIFPIGFAEQTILYYPVSILCSAVMLICFIAIIPFSRYWLFSKIPYFEIFVENLIYIGCFTIEKLVNFSAKLLKKQKSFTFTFIICAPVVLLYLWIRLLVFIFSLIMFIFYEIARAIAGTKRFKSMKKEQTFYDGIADWYIYEILSKPKENLTDQEKQIIYYFYKEYI